MEETSNKDNFGKSKGTDAISKEPVFIRNNNNSLEITVMELDFYNAAMKGNIDAFEGKGEQIESILTPNKNTILHIHCTNDTESVLETFVEKVLVMCPTLVLKTNVKGETILHIAARYGHHNIVKKLIECAKVHGFEKTLIRATNDKKDTALHEAARYGHTEVVAVLLQEEPDQSYFGKNIDDETPLYLSIERQHWKVVDTILDKSSSPQYNGPNGRNALHAAILHDYKAEKVSKLLTRNSSAAKQADENGWLPLHLAALCARRSEVIELLLREDRSTAYMRDNKGRTALHLIAFRGDLWGMQKILKYCPDCCELVDEKGFNALHYTTMRERPFFYGLDFFYRLKQMLQESPQVSNLCNEKDDDGNTPLHLLARRASECPYNYSHELLEPELPRVDKMAFNNYGQTVLDVAVAHVPPDLASENTMLSKLQHIGARLGGRVLDKHLREKKQEKRQDSAVYEKEKKHETYDNQDYFGKVATTLSVVAILIATVTFTAAFTLPGGLFQDGEYKGSPILKYNAAFIAFVITDALSFVLSVSVVFVIFLLSIVKIDEDKDRRMYASLLRKCVFSTIAAMGFMVIAFGTGIYAVLGVSKGFGVVTLLIVLSLFFVSFVFLCWIVFVTLPRQRESERKSERE